MSNISIFAKRAFLNTNPAQEFISKEESYRGHGHMQRVSSIIRADQIASYLGAKLNPKEGYQDGICIYIKPHVIPGHDFKFESKQSYIDIIDGWGLVHLLIKHPEVGVIACSKQDAAKLSKVIKNKIVFIPQHHCNFERKKRTREGIKTIGVIGTEGAWQFLPKGLEEELVKRNIELLKFSKFFSREDIVNFYLQIDLQLVWRPYRMKLSNPLKIVNAASFGIPTIAYDESVFKEVGGCYIGVQTVEEVLEYIDNVTSGSTLALQSLYWDVAAYGLQKAEEYHIENVTKLYETL